MFDRFPRKFDVQTSHKPSNVIFVVNIKFPRATHHTVVPSAEELYIPDWWMMSLKCSDWQLKLVIVSAIYLLVFVIDLVREFFLVLEKKDSRVFGDDYPLVWCILRQLFTSVSVKSSRYLQLATNIQHYSPSLR